MPEGQSCTVNIYKKENPKAVLRWQGCGGLNSCAGTREVRGLFLGWAAVPHGEGLPMERGSPQRGHRTPSESRGCTAWWGWHFSGVTPPVLPSCRQRGERQYLSLNWSLILMGNASYISLEPQDLNCIYFTCFPISSLQNCMCKYVNICVNISLTIFCKSAVIFTYAFSREKTLNQSI